MTFENEPTTEEEDATPLKASELPFIKEGDRIKVSYEINAIDTYSEAVMDIKRVDERDDKNVLEIIPVGETRKLEVDFTKGENPLVEINGRNALVSIGTVHNVTLLT